MTALARLLPQNSSAQVSPAEQDPAAIIVRPRWTLVFGETEAAAHVARTTDARALLPNGAASRLRWLALSAEAMQPGPVAAAVAAAARYGVQRRMPAMSRPYA